MSKLFEFPKKAIIPKPRVEVGEQILLVAFDLGLKTKEQPIAIVWEKCNGKTYVRKLFKDDEALELHRLLAE